MQLAASSNWPRDKQLLTTVTRLCKFAAMVVNGHALFQQATWTGTGRGQLNVIPRKQNSKLRPISVKQVLRTQTLSS